MADLVVPRRRPRASSAAPQVDSDGDLAVSRRRPSGSGNGGPSFSSGASAAVRSSAEIKPEELAVAPARRRRERHDSSSESEQEQQSRSSKRARTEGNVDGDTQHQHQDVSWKTGLVQRQSQLERQRHLIAESSEAFARSADDVALNERQKNRERAADPMRVLLARTNGGSETAEGVGSGRKPTRRRRWTCAPPQNRYGILPGYRWDGIDRSNGFEEKLFDMRSSKTARQEKAYAWGVEDM